MHYIAMQEKCLMRNKDGPIPVHILGNMWGQSWTNIYDIIYKNKAQKNKLDVTKIILDKNLSEIEMVEIVFQLALSHCLKLFGRDLCLLNPKTDRLFVMLRPGI